MSRTDTEPRNQQRIKPNYGSKFKKLALSFTLLTAAVTTLIAYAATEIPFVVSAYNAASSSSITSRARTVITLKNNGATLATAEGKLTKEGDLLVGKLPMTVSVPAIANKGTHKLNFNLSKTGRIDLQWLLDDKPYGGYEMKYFDADVAGELLTKEVTLNGMKLQLTVELKRGLALQPVPIRTFQPRPLPMPAMPRVTADKPMKYVTPLPFKRKAIGRTLIVEPRFVITNSSDGPGDSKIELVGRIEVAYRQIFNFDEKSVKAGESYDGRSLEFYDEYGAVNTALVALSGTVKDKDVTSSDDPVWFGQMVLDLRSIAAGSGEFIVRGDGNSESADLHIEVSKGPERFE